MHLLADLRESLQRSAFYLRRYPTGEVDLIERGPNAISEKISLSDVRPIVIRTTEALHIEFDNPPAEGVDPLVRLAVFPMISYIVIETNPGTVKTIDESRELAGALLRRIVVVVEHFVSNIFHQNRLPVCGGHRQ